MACRMIGYKYAVVMSSLLLPELMPIPVSPNDDYRAGSDGKIYSRTRYAGFGRKVFVDWYPLKGHKGKKNGYLHISLCHQNKKVTKNVHKLICLAFHGFPSSPSMQVRHLDGDPTNNIPSNLEWGTQIQNWQDRESHGRGIKGENHPQSKLLNAEREHIRWAVSKGLCSQRQAARALGMSPASISAICKASP